MNRKKIFPTLVQDEVIISNEIDNNQKQFNEITQQVAVPSRQNISKSEVSKFNSEIVQSPYTVIERNKLNYVNGFNQFEQMKLVENLASLLGLRKKEEKLQILGDFVRLFHELCCYLKIIENTILGINFDSNDFQSQFSQEPITLIEMLYKDIKTLEGFHIEIVFNSSVRYLQTVLEAQGLEGYMPNLNEIDIRAWQYSCTGHLLKFKVSPQFEKTQPIHKNCFQKFCCGDGSSVE